MNPEIRIDWGESPASNQGISIEAKLIIDEYNFPEILDIDEYFNALLEDGTKPLITCSCGVFSCGGYSINVIHKDKDVEWQFAKMRFVMKQIILIEIAEKMLNTLIQIKAKYENFVISSGIIGKDISLNINNYKEKIFRARKMELNI